MNAADTEVIDARSIAGDEPFMPDGRHQPATPQRKIFRK